MAFDFSKLRGKIKEVYGTQEQFSVALGISKASLSDKLNGKSDFSHSEIIASCSMLGIRSEEISQYFFCRAS